MENTKIKLTKMESNVVELIGEGMSSKETANELGISKRTVDFHLANVMGKTDTNNRVAMLRAVAKLSA